MERFGLAPAAVGLDAGYYAPYVCKGLVERDLYGVIGYRRPNHQDGYFYKREYTYDPSRDGMCARADSSLPIGQPIAWGIVNITPMPVIAGIAQHEPNAPGVRT